MNKPIEELIQRLKEPDYKYYGCELSRGEAELAISALEKQIPKKPIENFYDEQNGDDWYDEGYTYQCPLCKENEVGWYSKEMCEWVYQMAHCEKCGQAIDWSGDDE